jgi:hypothetical protein
MAYKFRVLLDSKSKVEVFRDIVIGQQATFEAFYMAIKSAFNFNSEQMASFYVSNEDWDKGEEISLMDVNFDPDADPVALMANLMLEDRVQDADQKFILVHDFMNMWIFLVELQGFVDDMPNMPEMVLAVGVAPAEDSREPIASFEVTHLTDESDEFDDLFDDDNFDLEDFDEGYEQFDY